MAKYVTVLCKYTFISPVLESKSELPVLQLNTPKLRLEPKVNIQKYGANLACDWLLKLPRTEHIMAGRKPTFHSHYTLSAKMRTRTYLPKITELRLHLFDKMGFWRAAYPACISKFIVKPLWVSPLIQICMESSVNRFTLHTFICFMAFTLLGVVSNPL